MGNTKTSTSSHALAMNMKVFALSCLVPLLAGLPTPEAESEGRGYPGLIQLDTNYVLPLLLAGAAFAKGNVFSNYGYGYHERSYGYPYGYYGYYGRRLGSDSTGHYADSAPSGEGASSQTQATNQYQQINQ